MGPNTFWPWDNLIIWRRNSAEHGCVCVCVCVCVCARAPEAEGRARVTGYGRWLGSKILCCIPIPPRNENFLILSNNYYWIKMVRKLGRMAVFWRVFHIWLTYGVEAGVSHAFIQCIASSHVSANFSPSKFMREGLGKFVTHVLSLLW